MTIREPLLLLSCVALAGCASTASEGGRQQVVVPTAVSQVYSEVDLQMKLAAAPAATADMVEDQCLLFEYQRNVRKLSDRLFATALRLHPDVAERGVKFRVDVAPSANAGVLSNAGGTLIVLQGTSGSIPDPVLAFILAREMGHVIGRHHDENSAASVMFSVLTQVLFPAAALVKGLSAVLPTTAAGTAVTASAVSYLGASALRTTYRDEHLREAEQIAFRLMAEAGWDIYEVAEVARGLAIKNGEALWLDELRTSLKALDNLAYGPRRRPFRVMPRGPELATRVAPVAPVAASAAPTIPEIVKTVSPPAVEQTRAAEPLKAAAELPEVNTMDAAPAVAAKPKAVKPKAVKRKLAKSKTSRLKGAKPAGTDSKAN